MSDANRTYTSEKNSPFRRAIVTGRKPEKGQVKVRFEDEDEASSTWVHVAQAATGANKSYWMPDEGSQVVVLGDWDGEDAVVMGALWSDTDGPPTGDGDTVHLRTASGADIIVGLKTGDVSVKGANAVEIEATSVTITASGAIALESETLTHNGKNIGDDHEHTDVFKGPDLTGPPA